MSEADEQMRLSARQAATFSAIPETKPGSLTSSVLSDVRVGLPGEKWPIGNDGEPMRAFAQINLTEAPYVPDALKDIALLCIFGDDFEMSSSFEESPNWCLRPYRTLEGLVPLVGSRGDGIAVRWEHLREDFPYVEEIPDAAAAEVKLFPDYLAEEAWRAKFPIYESHKIGGWGDYVQNLPPWHRALHAFRAVPQVPVPTPGNGLVRLHGDEARDAAAAFVLQLSADPVSGFAFGDGGRMTLARGTGSHADLWFIDVQCF